MATRDDFIKQGVSFLQNSDIKHAMFSEKIKYLESKGLTALK